MATSKFIEQMRVFARTAKFCDDEYAHLFKCPFCKRPLAYYRFTTDEFVCMNKSCEKACDVMGEVELVTELRRAGYEVASAA